MVKPSDLRIPEKKKSGKRPRQHKNTPLKGDKDLFALKNQLEKEKKE